jgi:CTP synthase
MGGTMRLGLYRTVLEANSLAAETYGALEVSERHRHRYEVNNDYRSALKEAGLIFSGMYPERDLVEFVELSRDDHPYYIGTQAHPEFKSRPTRPHPLFLGLITAAIKTQDAKRLL